MTTSQRVKPDRFAETFGPPVDKAVKKIKDFLTPYVQEYIANAPFVVMATSNAGGGCDASPKGGKPGFVRVLDDRHLLFPDVAGNKLFQSYQNLDDNPHIGLLFLIPGLTDTVRVNGKIVFVDKDELDQRNVELSLYETDDNSKHVQGVIVEVEESYAHCPRAINFSRLWDTEKISENKANRPIRPVSYD